MRLHYVRTVAPAREDSATGVERRRSGIRELVLQDGYARIEDLALRYDVSVMTVHRDLDALAAQGWVSKIRGGATANPSALVDSGVRDRERAMAGAKTAIAAQAARLLVRGQTVFLDDSTTALALVPHLVRCAPLTVATNFLPVLAAVGQAPGVDVVVVGGTYQPLAQACLGWHTTQAIANLHADLFFLSTTAVHDGSCYHRSEHTVEVKRAFLARASRSVLLVDHAKFGRPAPHLLAPLDSFDLVVTDSDTDPDEIARLRDLGVEVDVA